MGRTKHRSFALFPSEELYSKFDLEMDWDKPWSRQDPDLRKKEPAYFGNVHAYTRFVARWMFGRAGLCRLNVTCASHTQQKRVALAFDDGFVRLHRNIDPLRPCKLYQSGSRMNLSFHQKKSPQGHHSKSIPTMFCRIGQGHCGTVWSHDYDATKNNTAIKREDGSPGRSIHMSTLCISDSSPRPKSLLPWH